MLHKISTALVLAACSMGLGCNSGQQVYSKQAPVEVTPMDNVKAALKGYAESGQLDSGTEMLGPEIEKLRGKEGVDIDKLTKAFNELKTLKSPGQVTAKAKEMLALLP